MKEINTTEVFKNIKKHRGERFAKILREAELLDVPNIEHILEFTQLEDLERLIPTIRSKCKIMSASQYTTDKKPLELLDEAGYDAFIVETEKQKDSIKKYYRHREELCTFGDPHRHENFYIIHAVKRGADKIKPSENPEREDEYGTSVISIQIAKCGGFISIKNRYNHTVNNPDATFGNNPDNIIPGLTNSLRKFFDVEFNVSDIKMPNNYVWVNDQLVWYSFERDNIYIGDDYYFTGGTITRLNKDREIMFDGMIYNDKDKTITSPIDYGTTFDVFYLAFNGKKVTRTYNKITKETTLSTPDGNRIVTFKGKITELSLSNIKKIGNGFLCHNESLKTINLPNVEQIGEGFLERNKALTSIDLPTVKKIGNYFMEGNAILTSINMPQVEKIGDGFLYYNKMLTSISLPKVENIGDEFLYTNTNLKSINLPNVKEIGSDFLWSDSILMKSEYHKVSIVLHEKFKDFANELKLKMQGESKKEKFKNAVKKLFKKTTTKTQNKTIPDNSR